MAKEEKVNKRIKLLEKKLFVGGLTSKQWEELGKLEKSKGK